MDYVILSLCAAIALSCLGMNLAVIYMLWQHGQKKQETPVAAPEETPEEKEARRVAAEAQRKYDQAFIDMMNYSGQPRKKERDLL